MKHKRFSEEQVIGVLKEHEAGAKVDDICRRHGHQGRVPWRGVADAGQRDFRHGRADQSSIAGRPMIGLS